jgi:uncharacterized membrane protein YoaK (UPF0700 family)
VTGDDVDATELDFLLPPIVTTFVLASVAGYVDVFGYLQLFGTFTSNMSGNVVLLGIALGEAAWGDAARHGLALASFATGVGFGFAVDRRERTRVPLWSMRVLAIELLVLVGLTVVVAALGDIDFHRLPGILFLIPTAFAMGVQTPVITRTQGVATPTTYMSGTVAHLSEAIAARFRDVPAERHTDARRVIILAGVLLGYLSGAVIGTVMGDVWRSGALVVPTAALALLFVLRRGRRTPGKPA